MLESAVRLVNFVQRLVRSRTFFFYNIATMADATVGKRKRSFAYNSAEESEESADWSGEERPSRDPTRYDLPQKKGSTQEPSAKKPKRDANWDIGEDYGFLKLVYSKFKDWNGIWLSFTRYVRSSLNIFDMTFLTSTDHYF